MLIPDNQESACIFTRFQPHYQEVVHNLILAGLADHWGTIDPTLNPDLNDIHTNYLLTGAFVLVALQNDKVVGTGILIEDDGSMVLPAHPSNMPRKFGRIVRMSVDRMQRRTGIGSRIVQLLISEARTRGYAAVLIETNNDWYDAIGLYTHAGFSEYARDSESVYLVRYL